MGMSLEWIERLLVSEEKTFKDFAFFRFDAMGYGCNINFYIFVELYPRNILAKFHQDWSSCSGEKDV